MSNSNCRICCVYALTSWATAPKNIYSLPSSTKATANQSAPPSTAALATGKHIQEELKSGGGVTSATKDDIDASLKRLNKLNESNSGFDTADVKKELQECMQNYFGVFRRGEFMKQGLDQLKDLKEKVDNLHLTDKSDAFNTSRVEAIELQNLFDVAEATAISAYERNESRGAHARDDYPDRDDENWLCHTIFDPKSKSVSKREVNFNPSKLEAFPPKARTY